MLDKIIEWSLRNQFIVVIGVLFAILGGVLPARAHVDSRAVTATATPSEPMRAFTSSTSA